MAHDPWHELLELTAAVVLTGGGGIFVILAFIARRRGQGAGAPVADPGTPADLGTVLTVLAATLSLAAAAVHLAAAPAHIGELGPIGWGFVAAAAFQASWALAYGIEPSRGVGGVAIVGNAAILVGWLWSRTVGLPIGPLAGIAEPVGTPDAAATVFEILLIALLVARRVGVELRVSRRLRGVPSLATIAVVPAIGVVMLATTLAVSVAVGHSHVPSQTHGAIAGQGVDAHR